MTRKWIAFFVVAMIVAGGFISSNAEASDSAGCEGLAEYQAAMLKIGTEYVVAKEAIGIGQEREMFTLSSDDWTNLSEVALDYQVALKEIDVPGWVGPWHDTLIANAGLLEQISKTAAADGLLALIAFEDQVNDIDQARIAAIATVSSTCSDFVAFHRAWDALDGDIDYADDGTEVTPEAGVSVVPEVPFDTAQVVANGWTVRVIAVYPDPADIDPTATWFLDWLKDNPRASESEFFTVRLEIKNTSDEAGDILTSLGFGLKSESGFEYDSSDYCGGIPEKVSYDVQLDAGESYEGNLCWVVRTNHVSTLKLNVSPWLSFADADITVFSLSESPGATPTS